MPLISIIIPVYNTEKYLPKCLDSILKQTFRKTEIIVVNDRSHGNCDDIVKRYGEKIKYVCHDVNKGLFAARFSGVKVANGDYIAFLDSDDWVEPQMYHRLIQIAEHKQADIVQCGAFLDYGVGKKIKKWWLRVEEFVVDAEGVLEKLYQAPFHFYVWNKIYRKELFDSIGQKYFEISGITMHEDMLVSTLLFSNAERLVSVSDHYYNYRYRPKAETKAIDTDTIIRQMQSTQRVVALCKECLNQKSLYPMYGENLAAVTEHFAKLYYANKFARIKDKSVRNVLNKHFTSIFGACAVTAIESYHQKNIIRKLYDRLLPPHSKKRHFFKAKLLLR